jgi:hypothetical protein
MLAIIIGIQVLLAAFLNNSTELLSNRVLRLGSYDILLLPGDLLLSVFPCRIRWKRLYLFLFHIICPTYWNFLHLTVVTTLFLFPFYKISQYYWISLPMLFSKLFFTTIFQMFLIYLKLFWLRSTFLRHTNELKTCNTSKVIFVCVRIGCVLECFALIELNIRIFLAFIMEHFTSSASFHWLMVPIYWYWWTLFILV